MSSAELRAAAQQAERGNRLDFVDIAKGMMILAVVISHAWFANSDILADFLPFSMPVFFFLSGYTYRPGRSYAKNMLKRIVGLLIPYLIFCSVCNLFFPVYAGLVKRISYTSYMYLPTKGTLWTAVLRADAMGMLMSTPMWFLVSLFTASIIFYALADRTRDSFKLTAAVSAVLVAAAIVIDVLKKDILPCYIDLAPYAAALMLTGAYCGKRKLYANLKAKWVVAGLILLAAAEVLNRVFPGSARTSLVQYIEGGAWYGVLTALVIAVTGTLGTVCVARLLEKVPVLRDVFKWLGRNSLWILCIHYCFIMLVELWLYTRGQLTNNLLEVVTFQMYGFGKVADTPKDIILKLAVAVVSIGVSGVYALIHNAVKKRLKAARAEG